MLGTEWIVYWFTNNGWFDLIKEEALDVCWLMEHNIWIFGFEWTVVRMELLYPGDGLRVYTFTLWSVWHLCLVFSVIANPKM